MSNMSGMGGMSGGMGGMGGGGPGQTAGSLSSGNTSTAGGAIGGASTGGNSLSIGDMVVVRDYPEVLEEIDDMACRLDIQPLQVLIEAVILQVTLTDSQELGINFSVIDKLQEMAVVSGSAAAINAAGGFSPAKVLSAITQRAPYQGVQPGQLISGYTAAPGQGLRFGFVANNVSGFIKAVELFNKVNVLASPRVLVLNKQRAEIQLGRRLGYRNTVTNLTSSLQTVQFLSVGTLLELRPYVSNDGMIRLEVHPEKSTGAIDAAGVPQTNTSELTTNILVPDGATIVIGGLMDNSDQIDEQGILGLSRLPIIGPLFRDRVSQTGKTELIVLLTPRILTRQGLPGPIPGLPPKGPAGIPNSGPMPGPSLPPGAISLPPLPMGVQPNPRLSHDAASQPLLARGSAPVPIAPSDLPAGTPRNDVGLRPAGLTDTLSEAKPAPAEPVSAELPEEGYKPGDLTRAAVHRLSQMIPRHEPGSEKAKASNLMGTDPALLRRDVSSSATREQPAISYHVVKTGEDLSSIALQYYGSNSLRGALWAVNRDQVPSPDRVKPGRKLRVPPPGQLERMVLDAFRTDPAVKPASAPGSRARDEPRHGLRRLFHMRQ